MPFSVELSLIFSCSEFLQKNHGHNILQLFSWKGRILFPIPWILDFLVFLSLESRLTLWFILISTLWWKWCLTCSRACARKPRSTRFPLFDWGFEWGPLCSPDLQRLRGQVEQNPGAQPTAVWTDGHQDIPAQLGCQKTTVSWGHLLKHRIMGTQTVVVLSYKILGVVCSTAVESCLATGYVSWWKWYIPEGRPGELREGIWSQRRNLTFLLFFIQLIPYTL